MKTAFFGFRATLASSSRGLNFKKVLGRYDLHPVPSSLMEDNGSLIPGGEGKSKLMNVLAESHEMKTIRDMNVGISCHIVDGMFVVNKMVPKCSNVKTGYDLAYVFTTYVDSLTEKCEKIHVVFTEHKL